MEIRCSRCGHIGPAAQILPGAAGLALVCANCGHQNLLDLGQGGAATPTPAPQDVAPAPQTSTPPAQAPSAPAKPKPSAIETSALLEKLIPPPGDGLRCPKCANLVRADEDHCSRCGLDQQEASRFSPGQAPWDLPPRAKERSWEQAQLLWQSAVADWSAERVEKFIALIKDEGLHELGVRKLRFFLVDHPQDPLALSALHEVASMMQARVLVARNQADLDKKAFEHDVSKLRSLLMVGSLIFWVVILALFLGLFMKNCG